MSVCDLVIAEQVLCAVPDSLAVWLRERKPESLEDLATLAKDYNLARKSEEKKPLSNSAATAGQVAERKGPTKEVKKPTYVPTDKNFIAFSTSIGLILPQACT